MFQESCRNRQSGQKQCVAIGECQVNSLKGTLTYYMWNLLLLNCKCMKISVIHMRVWMGYNDQ